MYIAQVFFYATGLVIRMNAKSPLRIDLELLAILEPVVAKSGD